MDLFRPSFEGYYQGLLATFGHEASVSYERISSSVAELLIEW